jgi:hypothetical protein
MSLILFLLSLVGGPEPVRPPVTGGGAPQHCCALHPIRHEGGR